MTNDNKVYPVEIPRDDDGFYDRPFFAYGIFKRGQLAHSKIADYIKEVHSGEIPRKMHIRDGLPIVSNEKSEFATRGDKIYFWDDKKHKAYRKISNTQPDKIYRWDTVVIDGIKFNILISNKFKGTFENVDENGRYLDYYDGAADPIFANVSEFIRKEIETLNPDDEYAIFRIQMYYTLLWSAIDRYCVLKYDVSNSQGAYLYDFAHDKLFDEAFNSLHPKSRDPIYSANTANRFRYRMSDLNYIVNYYYTIRCNVVHRGKGPNNNIDALADSLIELLDIFDYILERTFQKDDEN